MFYGMFVQRMGITIYLENSARIPNINPRSHDLRSNYFKILIIKSCEELCLISGHDII